MEEHWWRALDTESIMILSDTGLEEEESSGTAPDAEVDFSSCGRRE